MVKVLSRAVGGLVLASLSAVAVPSSAGGSVVSIEKVTWSLTNPGGVGTFRVVVASSGTLKAGSVWAQASSPGAATIQGPIGAVAKPGAYGTGEVKGTANGRCYLVKLAIEPDSSTLGIKLDPKNSSRKVCLDPDGTGIIP